MAAPTHLIACRRKVVPERAVAEPAESLGVSDRQSAALGRTLPESADCVPDILGGRDAADFGTAHTHRNCGGLHSGFAGNMSEKIKGEDFVRRMLGERCNGSSDGCRCGVAQVLVLALVRTREDFDAFVTAGFIESLHKIPELVFPWRLDNLGEGWEARLDDCTSDFSKGSTSIDQQKLQDNPRYYGVVRDLMSCAPSSPRLSYTSYLHVPPSRHPTRMSWAI